MKGYSASMFASLRNNSTSIFIGVALSLFFIAFSVQAASTTIGTNIQTDGTLSVTGQSYFTGNVGIGTTTPIANLQVANGSNATTTMEVGSTGQNKGSCLKLYRTDGSAIYAYVLAGATTFSLSTVSCANVSNF